jgi:hypothetical protein
MRIKPKMVTQVMQCGIGVQQPIRERVNSLVGAGGDGRSRNGMRELVLSHVDENRGFGHS